MDIGTWPTAGYVNDLYPELRRLGLEANLAELQAFGFTVLTPAQVAAPGLAERCFDALLDVSERRTGVRPDVETGSTHRDMAHPLGEHLRFILWEHEVFEELLLNPAMLGLATWLLGPTCTLSLCNGMLKGPGSNCIQLHSDEGNRTMPLHPEQEMTVNATFLLTDYTRAGGALSFVPGSHRWRRDPTPSELEAFRGQMVPLEAPAGSIVVWGDHTWHGSYPRTDEGLRATVFFNFARHHLQTQEPYRQTCTQEALDRNPRRFAWLMDQFGSFPFGEADLDIQRAVMRGGYPSLFDREPTKGSIPLMTPVV